MLAFALAGSIEGVAARCEVGHVVKIIPPISTPTRAYGDVRALGGAHQGVHVLLWGQADPQASWKGILVDLPLLIVALMKAVHLKGLHAQTKEGRISPPNTIRHMRVTASEKDRDPFLGSSQTLFEASKPGLSRAPGRRTLECDWEQRRRSPRRREEPTRIGYNQQMAVHKSALRVSAGERDHKSVLGE